MDLQIKGKFPIFKEHPELVYLDSAATTQKPQNVIDAVANYYKTSNANIDRGVHSLGYRATELFEGARAQVQSFIGASEPEEIVFVRNTTEGMNLIANAFGQQIVTEGSSILLTEMEHHANIVPWVELAKRNHATVSVVPLLENGTLDLAALESFLKVGNISLLSITHISNVLGTINPIKEIVSLAHQHGARVVVDGAQAVAHLPIDVKDLDSDFYVFSGHKLFAPTGIGVVYGKKDVLDAADIYQGGGGMIEHVSFTEVTYRGAPHKFEAGTPHIAGAVGLGAAIDFVSSLNWDEVKKHETELLEYCLNSFYAEKDLRDTFTVMYDPGEDSSLPRRINAGIVSLFSDKVHAHDLGSVLDSQGIAVRVGHHCCQPLHDSLNIVASLRASLSIYNTKEDVDRLLEALVESLRIFKLAV